MKSNLSISPLVAYAFEVKSIASSKAMKIYPYAFFPESLIVLLIALTLRSLFHFELTFV